MRNLSAMLTLLLLAACGSSPKTHFYTLSVVPGSTGHGIQTPVQLAAVHIPPSLDRRQMVRLASSNGVEISETDRWSAPFDEMVRNILAQNLSARLPSGKLILPEAPAPQGTGTLVVTIVQFGPDPGGEVKLHGSWALLDTASGMPVSEHMVKLDAGPAPDADSTAAAMSRALGQLADRIAAGLTRSGI
ncbi:MAG TPA: PqiC family protein [Chthoniobacterales bacterium]|jgi:hypothetical protein